MHGVTQLGIRLRVLADRGQADAGGALRSLLEQHGVQASIAHTHPSLEDVFVVATRKDKPGARDRDTATRQGSHGRS